MSVELIRVDDRLIHGQVVVGWGRATNCEQIVLVDDAIAASEWEQELYRLGVPAGIDVVFLSVAAAAAAYREWAENRARTIVLIGDVDTLVRFCAAAGSVRRVNLGGVHAGTGRRERLPYVFLSDREVAQLEELSARGVAITAQDVPTAKPVALGELARR